MNIEDYLDIIKSQLIIRRYPNQKNRYSANIEHGEIKDGPMLCSFHGNGINPSIAIKDYIQKIKGRTLILNAYGDNRKEYGVPDNLEYKENNHE